MGKRKVKRMGITVGKPTIMTICQRLDHHRHHITTLQHEVNDVKEDVSQVHDGLSKVGLDVTAIKDLLENVAANGNKGLDQSLKDIHSKISELQRVTEPAKRTMKFQEAASAYIAGLPIARILFNNMVKRIALILLGAFAAYVFGVLH